MSGDLPLTADPEAIGKLARALAFICGEEHPATVAMQRAAASGAPADIKQARARFVQLKSGDRQAALAMIAS